MDTVDVVVLAGGRNSPAMLAATGEENRALTRINDWTMLDYVVEALRGASSTRHIFVVGDVPQSAGYTTVAGKETLLENVLAGLRAAEQAGNSQRVLVSTSDIPFLSPESVDDFVTRSLASIADFCYPIVPLALCRARFPEMNRTAAKVREGQFTGGNMVLVDPRVLLAQQSAIQRAYAARKSPLQMGRLLGAGLLLRVLLAQTLAPAALPLAALEIGVGKVLGGCRAAAIVTQFPEIGTDVDKPEDVLIARRLLAP